MASQRVTGHRHTAWQLVEHLRIAQWDMLEYTRTPNHVSPEFPAGYWPPTATPPDARAWGRSVRAFLRDLAAMERLVQRSRDVCAPIPHAGGVSLLREALLVNPFAIDQTAETYARALSMPPDERRARMRSLRRRVFSFDVDWWARSFVDALEDATTAPALRPVSRPEELRVALQRMLDIT